MATIMDIILIILCVQISLQQSLFNTLTDDDTIKSLYGMNGFMGAKARYTDPPKSYNLSDTSGRKLQYLFFLSRHGPRHTLNAQKPQQIVDLLDKANMANSLLMTDLVKEAHKFLRKEKKHSGTLSKLADSTIYNISKYMYENHRDFFMEVSKIHPIYFQSSYKYRCNQTMHLYHSKFIDLGVDRDGLILNPSSNCSSNMTSPYDYMRLRGYEVCKKYQDHHTERSWTPLIHKIIERERGQLLESFMSKIFTSEYVKSMTDLYEPAKLIYDTCTMLNNLYFDSNPFCEAIDEDLFRLFNYISDTDAYYDKGPYQSLNYVFSCPLFMDLLDILKNNNYTKEKGKFYFGHNESIYPFLSFLGLFKDLGSFHESRLFRTSLIYPMASNILLEIFADDVHEYVVRFILNGREIKLDNCDLFCPAKDLITIIESEISRYNIKNCTTDGLREYCDGFLCHQQQ